MDIVVVGVVTIVLQGVVDIVATNVVVGVGAIFVLTVVDVVASNVVTLVVYIVGGVVYSGVMSLALVGPGRLPPPPVFVPISAHVGCQI